MLITVVAISAVLLIFAAILPVLFLEGNNPQNPPPFEFSDPALSADPMSDTDYMQLDRTVYYRTLSGYEITVSVAESDLSSVDAELALLWRLVHAAMTGDADAYNACFSKEYIESSGKAEDFTKQKLYDITITLYEGAEQSIPDGYASVRAYGLAYKIKDNNGSLRRDMGSDAIKEQLFFVVKDTSGNVTIYGMRS